MQGVQFLHPSRGFTVMLHEHTMIQALMAVWRLLPMEEGFTGPHLVLQQAQAPADGLWDEVGARAYELAHLNAHQRHPFLNKSSMLQRAVLARQLTTIPQQRCLAASMHVHCAWCACQPCTGLRVHAPSHTP